MISGVFATSFRSNPKQKKNLLSKGKIINSSIPLQMLTIATLCPTNPLTRLTQLTNNQIILLSHHKKIPSLNPSIPSPAHNRLINLIAKTNYTPNFSKSSNRKNYIPSSNKFFLVSNTSKSKTLFTEILSFQIFS